MTVALSLVSQKGGVGKTTLSLNLAHSLAQFGFRVLLVDVDPQGGIGISLNDKNSVGGLKAYLAGEPLSSCVLTTRIPGFAILPLCSLRGLERSRIYSSLEDGIKLQSLVESASLFDVVMFDTPAGLAGSTLGALRASDLAFSVVQAEPLAMNTFPQLLEVLGDLREEGSQVTLSGLILTMVQAGVPTSVDVVKTILEKMPKGLVLDTQIPRDPLFLKASASGVPISLLRRRPPPIARRFDQLAIEVARFLPEEEGVDDEPISLLI